MKNKLLLRMALGLIIGGTVPVIQAAMESQGSVRMQEASHETVAPIESFDVSTDAGQCPIVIKFKAPKFYAGTEDVLPGIESIELYSQEYDYDQWTNVRTTRGKLENVTPGSDCEFVVNGPLNQGTYTWYVQVTATDGAKSAEQSLRLMVGEDYPGVPTDVVLSQDAEGNVKLTWKAPRTGANNGYIDPSALRYTVLEPISNWESNKVAENITECEWTVPAVNGTAVVKQYKVTATNAKGTSNEGSSNKLIVGPAETLPFAENFDAGDDYSVAPEHAWLTSTTSSNSYASSWRYYPYTYIGSERVEPVGEEGGMAYITYYSSDTEPRCDYLTSGRISLDGVTSLLLSYYYYAYTGNYTGTITPEYSLDNAEWMPLETVKASGHQTSGWTKVTEQLNVPQGSEYIYIRFCAQPGSVPETVAIDNVTLKADDEQQDVYPASVSKLRAIYDSEAENITLTFVAPTLSHSTLGDVNDQPLTYISRIQILRQIGEYTGYEPLAVIENPQPGQELKYIDYDLSRGGYYSYKVVVYVGNCCDYGAYLNESILVGQLPSNVTNLFLTTVRGAAPVVITFTAPDKDTEGKALKEIESILIERQEGLNFEWSDVTVLKDVAPGQDCEYRDYAVKDGEMYTYRVKVYTKAGNNYGTSGQVYVGQDQPERPTDIEVKVLEDGHVALRWKAPLVGVNGGYVDTETLTYKIYRGNGYSDYSAKLVAENVKETSWTDPTVFEEECAVRYFIKAVTSQYEGYSESSELVTVGPAPVLPYTESFNVKRDGLIEPVHVWTTSSTEPASDWSFAELAYFLMEGQIQPVDRDGGLAYCYYGPYSNLERDDFLTSGNINIEGTQMPVVRFFYYGVPGYDTGLALEVSYDGGEFEEVWSCVYSEDVLDEGWQAMNVVLDPDGAKVLRMRFRAHKGPVSCSAAIDGIAVFDVPAPVLNAGVSGNSLEWTASEIEFVELYGYLLYCDGRMQSNDKIAPEVTSTSDLKKSGDYTVTALYDGGQIESLHSQPVYIDLSGIEQAVADGAVAVYVQNGAVVVSGIADDQSVNIYSVDGRLVLSGRGSGKYAPGHGTYVVKAGNAPGVTLKL